MTAILDTLEDRAFFDDVLDGLSRPQKQLPAKYFYDAVGSQLFDRITELDEYYLTRVERSIMRRHASEMAGCCGARCLLLEFGAGSLRKVRDLLNHLSRPAGYVPIDVSGSHLEHAARLLRQDYPQLRVLPVCADFTQDFSLPVVPNARRVVYFPGSTIGNFDPPAAEGLMRHMARVVGIGGGVLLGVDLRKPTEILEAAYNDRDGVTAAFNLNLLTRINRELGADFLPELFEHHAHFNRELSRIEMHLVSRVEQCVQVGDVSFHFREGESIHTENSYKYDLGDLRARARRCGLRMDRVWTDERQYFAISFLTAVG